MSKVVSNARDRLIEAGFKVFSDDGWQNATTREIARRAGVNEVTLFRLFGSKQKLLVEVIRRFIEDRKKSLDQAVKEEDSLRQIFTSFAKTYDECFGPFASFIRSTLGEYCHNPSQAKVVMSSLIRDSRLRFLNLLRERQKQGQIRNDVDCELMLDLFIGMLFSQVVRPQLFKVGYTAQDYRNSCVDFIMRGVQP